MLAPPLPPANVSVDDDGRLRRLRMRLWLTLVAAATVLATVWCCTLGPIPGITALLVAKHVLVAILVMALNVDAPRGA